MKIAASIFCMMLFAAALEANRAYFTNLREVRVAEPQRQNWVAVDEEIWNHARADLGDLRMYSSEGEIPYLVRELSGGDRLSEFSARLLQLGIVAGRTSFFIDTSGAEEYNRVTLQLATRNFVGKAEVEGMDDIHSTQPTDLGTYSLYDFTRENLGSNFKLHLPDSRFKFLRVTLSKEVAFSDVKGATLAHWESEKAAFTAISVTPNIQQEHKQTTITWQASQAVPLERIVIATSDINFRRSVPMYGSGPPWRTPWPTPALPRSSRSRCPRHRAARCGIHPTPRSRKCSRRRRCRRTGAAWSAGWPKARRWKKRRRSCRNWRRLPPAW